MIQHGIPAARTSQD